MTRRPNGRTRNSPHTLGLESENGLFNRRIGRLKIRKMTINSHPNMNYVFATIERIRPAHPGHLWMFLENFLYNLNTSTNGRPLPRGIMRLSIDAKTRCPLLPHQNPGRLLLGLHHFLNGNIKL